MSKPPTPNDDFKDFIADQLAAFPGAGVVFKRMFGGYGIYRDGVFFGIVSDATLYLKTDDRTRGRFIERGMEPFRPTAKMTLKTYYEAPIEVVEKPEELAAWVMEAVAAKSEADRKPRRTKRRRSRKPAGN